MKLPRFVCQRDTAHCGPVALMNLDKWRGKKVQYRRDIHKYERKVNWTPEGTLQRCFNVAVGKRSRRISYALLKRIVTTGGVVVLLTTQPRKRWGHYYLVVGITHDNQFLCINYSRKRTYTLISWRKMARNLRQPYDTIGWTFSANVRHANS
jgi:hypothetical protein